jgi:hypothetical protein
MENEYLIITMVRTPVLTPVTSNADSKRLNRLVAHQKVIIANLEKEGLDTSGATLLLAALRDLQAKADTNQDS